MLPVEPEGPLPGFVTSLRFRATSAEDAARVVARLREVTDLLSGFAGFVDARVGRATDDATLIALQVGWVNVGAYRRALSSYDVKVSAVPLLAGAIDEPSAFEVLHVRDVSGSSDAPGALAADAGSVSLGEAAADYVPPAPS